jgi:hypothetical protein
MSVSARRLVPSWVAVKHEIADEDMFFVRRSGLARPFSAASADELILDFTAGA